MIRSCSMPKSSFGLMVALGILNLDLTDLVTEGGPPILDGVKSGNAKVAPFSVPLLCLVSCF